MNKIQYSKLFLFLLGIMFLVNCVDLKSLADDFTEEIEDSIGGLESIIEHEKLKQALSNAKDDEKKSAAFFNDEYISKIEGVSNINSHNLRNKIIKIFINLMELDGIKQKEVRDTMPKMSKQTKYYANSAMHVHLDDFYKVGPPEKGLKKEYEKVKNLVDHNKDHTALLNSVKNVLSNQDLKNSINTLKVNIDSNGGNPNHRKNIRILAENILLFNLGSINGTSLDQNQRLGIKIVHKMTDIFIDGNKTEKIIKSINEAK